MARRLRFLRRITRFRSLGFCAYSRHDRGRLDACSHQQTPAAILARDKIFAPLRRRSYLDAEVLRSARRREAWHDIKLGGELSNSRSFNWQERHCHRCLSVRIADRSIETITRVARVALNVELRTPRRSTLHFNHKVNVRCRTRRIRDRFDGPKIILAG